MSQDSKQYSCIIRFLDDSEPLTVTYQVSDVWLAVEDLLTSVGMELIWSVVPSLNIQHFLVAEFAWIFCMLS